MVGLQGSRWLLFSTALLAIGVLYLLPPIRIDPAYHDFADQRALFGIPNFWNVASSVPLAAAGIWGLAAVFRDRGNLKFGCPFERWAYVVLFTAVAMTGAGSAYYHWQPNSDRLVWDRLPMSVGFTALLAAAIAEFVDPKLGLRMLPLLVAAGIASVIVWHWTLMHGREDVRLYAAVQFIPMLEIVLMLALVPGRYTHRSHFAFAIGLYALAKAFEVFDRRIFALGHVVGGHTLKHLVAAAGIAMIARMLTLRQPRSAVRAALSLP